MNRVIVTSLVGAAGRGQPGVGPRTIACGRGAPGAGTPEDDQRARTGVYRVRRPEGRPSDDGGGAPRGGDDSRQGVRRAHPLTPRRGARRGDKYLKAARSDRCPRRGGAWRARFRKPMKGWPAATACSTRSSSRRCVRPSRRRTRRGRTAAAGRPWECGTIARGGAASRRRRPLPGDVGTMAEEARRAGVNPGSVR